MYEGGGAGVNGFQTSTAVFTIFILLKERKEGNVLFDILNTFYLQLYGIRHRVKDHSDSES